MRECLENYVGNNFDFDLGYEKVINIFDRVIDLLVVVNDNPQEKNIINILKKSYIDNDYEKSGLTFKAYERSIYRALNKMFPNNVLSKLTLLKAVIDEACGE